MPVLPRGVGSPALRRPSLPHAKVPSFSATRRIAGDRTSSPPAFFLPVSARPWPIGAAARVFPWAWALRVSRPASPPAWAPGASAGAVAAAWLLVAPAHRPAVKRSQRAAGRGPGFGAWGWGGGL